MAIIDNIKFNGTDYLIGASDSVKDVIPASDFGFNFANGTNDVLKSFATYPCDSFQGQRLTVISPDYGAPVNASVQFRFDGTYENRITVSMTGSTLLYVKGKAYRAFWFDINVNTEYTPKTVPSNAKWKFYIPYGTTATTSDVYVAVNVDAFELTSKYIADVYNLPQGVQTLNGKKWLALGDSYTNYLCGGSGAWTYLAGRLGMTLSNYGIVSSTIRVSSGGSDYAYQPMSQRVDTMISEHAEEADDIGLITFMGGTNDGYTPAKIGTLESTALTTIYGGCHHIFNSLVEAFPKALIMVILQPVSGNGTATEDGFDAEQNSIYGCQVKQRAVKETAEFYGLPICDCCFDWYTTANPNHLASIWRSDKLHLTSGLGDNYLTNKMVDCIEKVLTID